MKNLLFVFADQWRGDALGFAGADPVKTPNMDAFCRESTYCDHAFSTFPVCSPHRASLMTGKYPLSAGFFTNCKKGLHLRLRDDELCMGQILKNAGYQTAYIGKWHLDEPEQNSCEHPISGAADWDAYTPPGVRRHGFDYWYSYGTYDMHLNPHYWQDTPEMIQPAVWSPQHETDKAIEYMGKIRNPDRPFALCLSWNPPHSVYSQVPEAYLREYGEIPMKENVSYDHIHHHTGEQVNYTQEEMQQTTRQYFAAVTGLDHQFGRLIKALKEQGLYDDTVVVLSADHGDMMGSHGLMGKHVWYEESIRIPFVVHIPGKRPAVCHTCLGSQDMLPTVLGLLHIPVPETVEGEDCSGYLLEHFENPERVSFLCACPGGLAVVGKFRQAGKDPRCFGWRGVRTGNYTYVMELGYQMEPDPHRYLYDLREDPQQMHPMDLGNRENRNLADRLEEKVMIWMAQQKDGFSGNWMANAVKEQ